MKAFVLAFGLSLLAACEAFVPLRSSIVRPKVTSVKNVCKFPPKFTGSLSSTTETAESYKFESNVSRVMDIIINSLYSNKDVFIRELVRSLTSILLALFPSLTSA